MAWARCTTCTRRTWWDARQGARLRDRACGCGGRLEAATGNVGRHLTTCPLCRQRRFHPGTALTREVECDARVWARGLPPEGRSVRVAAGTVVCRDHQVEPLDLQGGMDGQPVWVVPHPHVAKARAIPGLGDDQTYRATLRRRGEDLVAEIGALGWLALKLTEVAWRPVPREEVPAW